MNKFIHAGVLLVFLSTSAHATENTIGTRREPIAAASTPGFDCRRSRTPVEKTICSDPALAAQDSALASVYRKLRVQLPAAERDRLTREQRAWLNETRDRCADSACIGQTYVARLAVLRARLQARPNSIKQVVLGPYHSCTLTVGGAVSCRGRNDSGQVGNGKRGGKVARPTPVIAQGATQIAAGDSHSCAVVKGALLCWGGNYSGAVGNGKSGEENHVARPTQVIASGVRSASAGGAHTCAVVNDSLWCWGSNEHSQLGRGVQQSIVLKPAEIISQGVTGVSAGQNHTCAIVSGTLQCWGYNYNGQVGNGSPDNHVPDPVTVMNEGVTTVSAGEHHSCAIANGALYCWGSNSSGEIGTDAGGSNPLKPVLVLPRGATDVSAGDGEAHTCAIVDAALYCWGNNFYGQIGNGPPGRDVRSPTKVIDSGVTAVATRGHHTCAVIDGAEQCWRYSGYGEIDPHPPGAAAIRPPLPASASGNKFARYVGTFKGSLISSGTEFVITRFVLNKAGEMIGDYTTIPYQGSSKKSETGTLDACEELPESEIHCKWHDAYGTGLLAVQFDAGGTEFRGSWYPENYSHVPHMKREYWLSKTTWNGVRQ